jgi:hypothetical protein
VRLKIALGLLLLPAIAAAGIEVGKSTFGTGPGGVAVKAEWAVALKGSFDYKCDFVGPQRKAFVLYHLVGTEWKMLSICHTAGGKTFHVPASTPPSRLAVTGWYGEGTSWKQCNLNGWKKNADGTYLACRVSAGETLTFTCLKGQCRKP